MNRIYHLFLALLFMAGALQAQPGPKPDERARELVSLAKKYYKNQAWLDAAMSFELATQRPEHDLTTYSWYMAGLSYYNGGEFDKANTAFGKLLKEYPRSKYAEDAQYHKGLILLDSKHTNDRERGLDQMFTLLDKSGNKDLKAQAESAVKHYIFDVYDITFLNLYKVFARDPYRVWFIEALAAQYDRQGNGQKALAEINDFYVKGGIMTPYLTALKERLGSGRTMSSSRLNIAIFLSFYTDLADSGFSVPTKSVAAVEMLEGMMIALDSIGPLLDKEINIQVFDTRGDTLRVTRQLDTLSRFNPDIIIGDIRTSIATIISKWAEQNKTVHIIPKNPLNELISNKQFTFLAHPSLYTHGRQLSEYLVKKDGKRSLVVFNDKSYYSERLSQAFIEGAKAGGASVKEVILPRDPAGIRTKASSEITSMKSNGTDGVYVPISNEEGAGMIISYLNYHNVKTALTGGPDWEAFNVIDAELKTSYGLRYTTFYYDKNDSLALETFTDACVEAYDYLPTSNTIMGYDLMAWVLEMGKQMNSLNEPTAVIHKAPVYHGIHQDFYFGDKQDNQRVNIVQFNNGRLEKVNRSYE